MSGLAACLGIRGTEATSYAVLWAGRETSRIDKVRLCCSRGL